MEEQKTDMKGAPVVEGENKSNKDNEEVGVEQSGVSIAGDNKLETLEKILKMLKRNDSKYFMEIMEQVMIGLMAVDLEKKNMFYELLTTFLKKMNDCRTKQELVRFKDSSKVSFQLQELNKITLEPSWIQELVEFSPFTMSPFPVVLGMGSFSVVLKGILNKPNTTAVDVAIKESKTVQFEKMILDEARILAELNHPNIIKVLGFLWSTKKDGYRMVLEYMSAGNLEEARQHHTFSVVTIFNILYDVASALEYLASKKYIHRDVARRNIFMHGKNQTKLADFGLAKYVGDTDGVYVENERKLNSRNTSPESFFTQQFRTETDIWAYGLLIWDLFYVSEKDDEYFDYQRLLDNKEVLGHLVFDISEKLPRPPTCPRELYRFVKDLCMCQDYQKRPNFTLIKTAIERFRKKRMGQKK